MKAKVKSSVKIPVIINIAIVAVRDSQSFSGTMPPIMTEAWIAENHVWSRKRTVSEGVISSLTLFFKHLVQMAYRFVTDRLFFRHLAWTELFERRDSLPLPAPALSGLAGNIDISITGWNCPAVDGACSIFIIDAFVIFIYIFHYFTFILVNIHSGLPKAHALEQAKGA